MGSSEFSNSSCNGNCLVSSLNTKNRSIYILWSRIFWDIEKFSSEHTQDIQILKSNEEMPLWALAKKGFSWSLMGVISENIEKKY